jgi:hypothetical protein
MWKTSISDKLAFSFVKVKVSRVGGGGFSKPREGEKRSNIDQLEHREYPI